MVAARLRVKEMLAIEWGTPSELRLSLLQHPADVLFSLDDLAMMLPRFREIAKSGSNNSSGSGSGGDGDGGGGGGGGSGGGSGGGGGGGGGGSVCGGSVCGTISQVQFVSVLRSVGLLQTDDSSTHFHELTRHLPRHGDEDEEGGHPFAAALFKVLSRDGTFNRLFSTVLLGVYVAAALFKVC